MNNCPLPPHSAFIINYSLFIIRYPYALLNYRNR